MQYPLIDRNVLADLRLVHAFFNSGVLALFFYQAWLGITVRRARLAGGAMPLPALSRHRKSGPILAMLGLFGFLVGFVLALLDTGNVLEYPAHLITGTAIISLLSATYVISRKIKGQYSAARTPHFVMGIMILCLYLLEAFLGISALF
jgi:hypothetical protein